MYICNECKTVFDDADREMRAQTTIRLPQKLMNELKKQAYKMGISLNGLICTILLNNQQ